MDKRMFDASGSKQLQLLRGSIIVAMAARVGNASARDGREADAFVEYLQNAADEINFLAAYAYDDPKVKRCVALPDNLGECDTYAAMFESELPQLEYKTVRLVIAALPQRQASDFASAAAGGNVLSAAWKALRLAAASLDGLHRGSAAYRSALEVEALVVAKNGRCDDPMLTDESQIATVDYAVRCLGLSSETLSNPLGKPVLPTAVPATAFETLFAMMRNACRQLPVNVPDDGGGKPKADPIASRIESCDALRFEPVLRYGTIKPKPMPAPVAPATITS